MKFTKIFGCSTRITDFLIREGFSIDLCAFAKTIIFKGVCYATDSYVVLNKLSNDLLLGKVIAMFVTSCNPHLIVQKIFAEYGYDYGMYSLERNATHDLTCVHINELKDYYPLYSYNVAFSKAIVLKTLCSLKNNLTQFITIAYV